MGFNFRNAVGGAASGVADLAGTYMKSGIKKAAEIDLAKIRGEIEKDRDERLYEIKNRDRRSIGSAFTAAGQSVSETGVDEEGNEITKTRTPSRAEQLAAGERRALELGDIDSAKNLKAMGAPKLTKVGQDETILNERGETVFANTAGAERRKSEMKGKHSLDVERDRLKVDREYGLRLAIEKFKITNGTEKTTALMQNISFLKEQGIAEDSKSAFEMLRTSMSKPEDQAILDMSKALLRGPGYRGRDGQQRALDDAENLVTSVRRRETKAGNKSRSAAGAYSSAEDVRDAYRAGKIGRSEAELELLGFPGFK